MKGIIKVDEIPDNCYECHIVCGELKAKSLEIISIYDIQEFGNEIREKRLSNCPIVPLDEVVEALETIEKRYTHMYMTMSQNVINGQVMVYDNPMRGFNTIRKALGVEE